MRVVTSIATVLIASMLTAGLVSADTEGPAAAGEEPAPVTIEAVIIRTLHDGHYRNPNYGVKALENILVALEPAAICVELPTTWSAADGGARETDVMAGAEGQAMLPAAKALLIPLLPYDRAGRNERYRETRYFERQQAADAGYKEWQEEIEEKESDSLDVQLADVLNKAAGHSQAWLTAHAFPEIINSEAYDGVIRIKHKLWHDMLPPILAEAGYEEVADTWLFMAKEWRDRNRIMADNIVAIAARFPGKRLAVVTGSEHGHILRDLLSEEPTVTLKEFWEVIPDDVRARDRLVEAEHFAALKQSLARVQKARSQAWAYLGSWREVEQACLEVLALTPYDQSSRCCLSYLYVRWGDYERALSLLPDNSTAVQRACALDALGRREEAVAIYESEVRKTHNPTVVTWARRGLEGPVWFRDLDLQAEPGEVPLTPAPSWRASASHACESLPARHAIDGDLRTLWTTRPESGAPRGQLAGQWFVLDVGSPQTLSRVLFDHQGVETIDVHSWPHVARASISTDGSTWEEVDHSPAGPLEPLTLTFDPARPVRAVRIELTEDWPHEWWSIHEVYVFAPGPARARVSF